MTQPVKKDSQSIDSKDRVYLCPAIGCTNFYEPFGNGGRVVSGCSLACSVQAKREAGTTVIELDSRGGQ